MSRIDLFLFAHKGLRRAMFDSALRLGCLDFEDPVAAAATLADVRGALEFLREHAIHEERIFEVLGRFAPGLAAGLANEHAQIAAQETKLAGLLDRFLSEASGCETMIGRHVLAQYHRVVALHLAHMEREEEEANRVLTANCTDAELGALHASILADITPERRAEWQAIILPGLSLPDRELLQRRLAAQVQQ